jgi:hypothetical protein
MKERNFVSTYNGTNCINNVLPLRSVKIPRKETCHHHVKSFVSLANYNHRVIHLRSGTCVPTLN